jgi:hypothetical protein
MRENTISFNVRFFVASAYLLFVPAVYIVLSRQKLPLVHKHGVQALYLWIGYFIIFFGVRFLVNALWKFYYFPLLEYLEIGIVFILAGYCFFSALRAFLGQEFAIPR